MLPRQFCEKSFSQCLLAWNFGWRSSVNFINRRNPPNPQFQKHKSFVEELHNMKGFLPNFCLFLAFFGGFLVIFGAGKRDFCKKIAKKCRKWRVPLTKICISVSRSVSEKFGYVLRKSGARKMQKNGQKTPNFASIFGGYFWAIFGVEIP